MPITPQDIQSKQFHVRMRGFDVDEVDKFLEKIAEEFLILTLENKQTMEKIESLEKEIANFRNKEQTFQNAILSAQRISEEMQERSRQEAENTVTLANKEAAELQARTREEAEKLRARAHQEASEMKRNAQAEASRIENNALARIVHLTSEVNNLVDMKDRISNDLKQLLENYLQRISEGIPAGLDNLEKLAEPDLSSRAAFQSFESATPDDDLSDLYEKIDLREVADATENDYPLESGIEPEVLGLEDLEPFEAEDKDEDNPGTRIGSQGDKDESVEQEPDISIPDLDGDMLFSLDDPLDELEPSVMISPKDHRDS